MKRQVAGVVSKETEAKLVALRTLLRSFDSVCIGYSGGVDSVLLARVAVEVLGTERVLAVTGISASYPMVQRTTARECAVLMGVSHIEIRTDELDDARYAANPADRCYYCKSELWPKLAAVARTRGFAIVLDGSNADDATDYRPGFRAAQEQGVRSPLLETGLTKREIRALSQDYGLPTWDQPSAPCLSSRLPYGVAVTTDRLRVVEEAETALRAMGFTTFRVRHHDDCARVEFAPAELERAWALAVRIDSALRDVGFARVLLDVEGYRQGALNEVLVQIRMPAAGRALPPHEAAGHHRDIAVLADVDPERARDAADALRAAGFRYVAIDLSGAASAVGPAHP